MRIKLLFYAALLLTSFFILQSLSLPFGFSAFVPFLEALLIVSGMVFTIMGIWIAFLYPNALQRIMDPNKVEFADFSQELSDTKRLESIVGSVLRSAFVAMIIVLIFLAKPLLSFFSIIMTYQQSIMNLFVTVIIFLTILQLESIIDVMISNVKFLNELHRKRQDREEDLDI